MLVLGGLVLTLFCISFCSTCLVSIASRSAELDLGSNQLSGAVPEELYDLATLSMSCCYHERNKCSFCEWRRLQYSLLPVDTADLEIQTNLLSGTISTRVGLLTNLGASFGKLNMFSTDCVFARVSLFFTLPT